MRVNSHGGQLLVDGVVRLTEMRCGELNWSLQFVRTTEFVRLLFPALLNSISLDLRGNDQTWHLRSETVFAKEAEQTYR